MTAAFKNSRYQLGILVFFGAFLRLLNLGRDSLWLDEAISYLTAQLPVDKIAENIVQSSSPPLYYLLLHFWMQLLPDSDVTVRLHSVLWSVLLIPASYHLCQQLFKDRTSSITAAALLTISPFHILYAHELRMYTQLMIFVVAGTSTYWHAHQSRRHSSFLAAGLFFLLAVYTHMFAMFALAGIGLYALLGVREDRSTFWATMVMTAVILIAYGPWVNLVLAEAGPALGSLRPLFSSSGASVNPVKPIATPVFLLFGMSNSFWYSGLILFCSLSYLIVFVVELRRLHRIQIPASLKLMLLITLSVLAPPLLVYMIRPFFLPERTFAAASPFLIILLGWGITRTKSPLPYLTVLTALLMFVGTAVYHSGSPIKPPYRDATAYVAEHATPTDLVLHTSDGSYLPALRYAPRLNQGLLAGDPDPRKSKAVYEALGGEVWTLAELDGQLNDRFWLVVALEHSESWQLAQAGHISAMATELDQKNIGGIQIYLYEASR